MNETRSSTASQMHSQGYTAVPTTEELGLQNDTTTLLASHIRGSILSGSAPHRAISEDGPCDTAAGSIDPEKHNVAISTTSLDKTIRPRSRFQNLREIVVKFWLWEAGACVLSLMCLASIVGILAYEDGKLLDEWGWSVPPTAVVSFIGTLGKAATVLVLSQILSQLKWLHFKEIRSLRHVRIFDGASRGPLGAVLIVWGSRKVLVSVAACLMILTILFDPFVQLVFTFPSRLVEDDSQQALFYRTNQWRVQPVNISVYGNIDGPLSLGVLASISDGLTLTKIPTAAVCPSGNCSWPDPIRTLGLCGSCQDVTMDVNVSCLPIFQYDQNGHGAANSADVTCNYTYTDGHMVQAHRYVELANNDIVVWDITRTLWNSSIIAMESSYSQEDLPVHAKIDLDGHPIVPQPSSFAGNDSDLLDSDLSKLMIFGNRLINFRAIQLPPIEIKNNYEPDPDPTKMPTARCWDCSLSWCEKSFENVRITNNAPPEYQMSTKNLSLVSLDGLHYGLYPDEFDSLNTTVWNFRYQVDPNLNSYLSTLFDSYFVDSGKYNNLSASNLDHDLLGLSGLAMSKDLNATIYAIADSLSEVIRTGQNSTGIVGQTFVPKSFIRVRWAWLALPLALAVTTYALLAIVAVRSHSEQVAVWKDDPLALLFHSVKGADILPGGNYKTGVSDLDNLASEVYVKLDRDRPFKFVVSSKGD